MEAEKQDHNPKAFLRFLRSNQLGATMIEYVILTACIAVVALAGVASVGDEVGGRDGAFAEVGEALAGANWPDQGGRQGRRPRG